jgi:hypothetical protein
LLSYRGRSGRSNRAKQVKGKNPPPRAALPPPAPTVWDLYGAPAIERFALPLALCFILIGAARIVSTYRALSVTTDEPYHFSCGLDYLTTGRACAPENPPLQPLASALLPYLDGARADPAIDARWHGLGNAGRDNIGREQMWSLFRTRDPWRLIVRMRAGVLPFFILAALAIFFGARHFFGNAEAVLATALFTLVPSVLAHASLATTDISVTAALAAAFFLLAWWSEAPSWKRAVCLGLALGLAVFAKFSAIPYFAAGAAVAALFHLATSRRSRKNVLRLARQRTPGLFLAGGVAAFVLWAGCLFSFGGVEGWPAWIKVPAPELFAAFRELVAHTDRGHPSYLLGEFVPSGRWNYYGVVLWVKTPIGLMLAVGAGLFACWERRARNGLLPIAFCLGVLLVAMTSSINIGIRHVLPVFIGLSVIGGLGLVRLARISVFLPAALLAWIAISGVRAHPDYLSYFNGFAGEHPEEIIVDSDLEWQQSWVRMGGILRARRVSSVTLDLGRPNFETDEVLQHVYGMPAVRSGVADDVLTPGFHVVDAGILRYITSRKNLPTTDPSVSAHLVALRGPSYAALKQVDRVGGLYLLYAPPVSR